MYKISNEIKEFDNLKRAEKKTFLIVWSIALVVLLALDIFGVVMHIRSKNLFVETDAVISRIETVVESDGDTTSTTHYVYVEYEVDGVEYKDVPLNYYSFTMKEGDTIKIRYNPKDPTKMHSNNSYLILVGFASVFVLISVVMLVKMTKNRKRDIAYWTNEYKQVEELKRLGNCKRGKIIDVIPTDTLVINSRQIYAYVIVKYLDEVEDIPRNGEWVSKNIKSTEYSNIDKSFIGGEVDVYVGRDPYKDYYIDVAKVHKLK